MKKFIYFDLFHLSLVLSLLRLNPYRGVPWYNEPYDQEVYLGDSAAYTQTRFHNLNNHQVNGFVHPKNIDNAIERTLFLRDVNSIYRRPLYYSQPRERNIFAYILNELRPHNGLNTAEENPESGQSNAQNPTSNTELTQADLDLIEMLWKQDIDTGFSREIYDDEWNHDEFTEKLHNPELNTSSQNSSVPVLHLSESDSIDSDTEKYVETSEIDSSNNAAALVPNQHTDVEVDEALSLFDSDTLYDHSTPIDVMLTSHMSDDETADDLLFNSGSSYPCDSNQSLLDQLCDLQQMVSESHVDPYPEDFEPLHSGYSDLSASEDNSAVLDALLENPTLMLPFGENLLDTDELAMEHDVNINSLLSFLSNDSDPNPVGAVGGQVHSDVDPNLSVANLSVDNAILSQIMSEGNMDFSDFPSLPVNTSLSTTWERDTSNDSAVSGMGSDWSDSCSDESKTGDYSDATGSLDGPMEFDFKKTIPSQSHSFKLFGKQGPHKVQRTTVKSKTCSKQTNPDDEHKEPSSAESFNHLPRLAFVHNHTYHQSDDSLTGKEPPKVFWEKNKPQADVQTRESIRGTRDDKRLRNTKLPLTVKEIVEMPIEEFNQRLTELHLSDEHLSLIRDIRRRGKNKVAARTCRKRKVDQISGLQGVIDNLLSKRELAHANMEKAIAHRDFLKQKYQRLHQFIFPGRDPPDPAPASYLHNDLVIPPVSFPINSNSTNGNDNERKKRGKHKGANIN